MKEDDSTHATSSPINSDTSSYPAMTPPLAQTPPPSLSPTSTSFIPTAMTYNLHSSSSSHHSDLYSTSTTHVTQSTGPRSFVLQYSETVNHDTRLLTFIPAAKPNPPMIYAHHIEQVMKANTNNTPLKIENINHNNYANVYMNDNDPNSSSNAGTSTNVNHNCKNNSCNICILPLDQSRNEWLRVPVSHHISIGIYIYNNPTTTTTTSSLSSSVPFDSSPSSSDYEYIKRPYTPVSNIRGHLQVVVKKIYYRSHVDYLT